VRSHSPRPPAARDDLALDALEQAIGARGRDGAHLAGLIHHSDPGAQYLP
jgi:transposase InsO family protein